jgi:glycosyltransferase involved in cell wall biosynthesis
MSRICFASYEIHPITSGGCGVLLHNSAHVLLSQGHEVIFLLDLPEFEFNIFNQQERLKYPHHENCKAYLVETLCKEFLVHHRDDFQSEFEWRAFRFYLAARWITKNVQPNHIEFFDYCGVAYYTLAAKLAGIDFQSTIISIRLHTSLELIDREQPSNIHNLERYIMFGMEHQALRLAETILYPSKHNLRQAYSPFYESWFGQLTESHPAIVTYPKKHETLKDADGILFLGRLFGIKGIDIFVDAAVYYLDNPDNPRRSFIIAGYDSNLPPDETG